MFKYLNISLFFLLSLVLFSDKAIAEEALTWKACIEEARKNHPDLIAAEEAVKVSEADRKSTASALFPQIDANAGASRTKVSGKTSDSYSYGVSGTQLLFDGLKVSDKAKAASESIKAAQYNYKFTSSAVRFRLRSVFINLLKAQELLNIDKQIYDIRRSNLELITLRYESGIEHKGALLNAEADLSRAEFEIAQSERALESSQRALTKEMGRAKFSPMRADGILGINERNLVKPDFESLADKNPSLAKFTAQKNAASFGIKAAEADFFPQLSAQAGVDKKSANWPPEDGQWNSGLTLTLPLFEGGFRHAEVAKARALFNQAEANERGARDGIILTLQQDWAAFQDAVDMAGVQKKFLAAAEERSRIAAAQYSLGLIQFDNWTIIEDALVGAKKALLDAEANALATEASWIQAKGETLEYAD